VILRLANASGIARSAEPVVIGVPLPPGTYPSGTQVHLVDDTGREVPCDFTPLDRWPDGSVRWALLSFRAECAGASVTYRLAPGAAGELHGTNLTVANRDGICTVDTGAIRVELREGGSWPVAAVTGAGGTILDVPASGLELEGQDGRQLPVEVTRVWVETAGSQRAVVRASAVADRGAGKRLEVDWRFHFFAGLPVIVVDLTLRNPHRAVHPDGYWELGDPGSFLFEHADLVLAAPAGGRVDTAHCSAKPGEALAPVPVPFELYQDSSGGENWRSTNHVNREGRVPVRFRGYRRSDEGDTRHLRANPIVCIGAGVSRVSLCLRHFWQNFPKSVEVGPAGLRLGLFPRQWDDLHELQGGEQKTHTVAISFGNDPVTQTPLEWFREPLVPQLDPEWVASTGAVPYLVSAARDPHDGYKALVNAAIEGPDTFERKREVIDEYGWRNFGDIWGDHEAAYPVDPTTPQPLISHYNNQYDQVAGFCYQWLRTGDARWWSQFVEGARHVADIDIYHTDEDKAAYNHGLFWHTYHYVDAHRSTHRSYPHVKGPNGGGPANEQNYPAGLMLHYFVTGDTTSREAALGLAQFVIDMDDGRRTVFRWLAGGDTGRASQSRTEDYHGPGRGSGNSLNALLVGHRLSGDPRFLAKAEQLIRRVSHPEQDLGRLTLLDAENRWFYTMYLQALGAYLDHKAELGQLDTAYAYAQATLLHYARWMADHEYPYLEKPEILEYPTETWAAQDMRKCAVFQYAMKHASGPERARFAERAAYFFDYAVRKLSGMKERTLCRPVVLLMSYGWSRAWFVANQDISAPVPPTHAGGWGPPVRFVPQKAVALKRAKAVVAVGVLAALAAAAGLAVWGFS
jgi:hypothetical protein